MAHNRQVPLEALLGQADWLKGLARHLAGEAGEDLAQDGLAGRTPRTAGARAAAAAMAGDGAPQPQDQRTPP